MNPEWNGVLILFGMIILMFAYLFGLAMWAKWIEMDEFKKSLERQTRWREFYDEQPEESEWWK